MPRSRPPTTAHGDPHEWRRDHGEWFDRCPRCSSIHPQDLLHALVDDRMAQFGQHNLMVARLLIRDEPGGYNRHRAVFASVHTLEPWLSDGQREELFKLIGWRFERTENLLRLRATPWRSPYDLEEYA